MNSEFTKKREEIFQHLIDFEISGKFDRLIDIKTLQSRLVRNSSLMQYAVLIESEAHLEPNYVNGVQKGWTSADSTYQLAMLSEGFQKELYPFFAFAVGFKPDHILSIGTLLSAISDLILNIESRDYVCLSEVNSRSMTLVAKQSLILNENDVDSVIKFNKRWFADSCADLPERQYYDMFIQHNFLAIGMV